MQKQVKSLQLLQLLATCSFYYFFFKNTLCLVVKSHYTFVLSNLAICSHHTRKYMKKILWYSHIHLKTTVKV